MVRGTATRSLTPPSDCTPADPHRMHGFTTFISLIGDFSHLHHCPQGILLSNDGLIRHNDIMGLHVPARRLKTLLIFFCQIRRQFISAPTECLMGNNTKLPFFCRPLARVYSQMLFIAVVTTHQRETCSHHSNGTKERELCSAVFSISVWPPPPGGLLMRASSRVKTDIGKKGGCFFAGLSKHLHAFPR